MDAFDQLVVATLAFLGTHFVTSTPLRAGIVGAIGEKPYLGLYSLVALATLVWMSWAYSEADRELLWNPIRFVPSAVMPFAFILLACGYARNPTMVMAERLLKSSDPARGMIRVTRHPIMWAIMLWAGAHIVARGDAKSLVFFGGFLALGALGTLAMDARKARTLGEDWKRFAAVTSHVPFVAIAQGRNRLALREIGWARPLAGVLLYGAFFPLHLWLIGARPW
jgi:uncharacterized membrane protein